MNETTLDAYSALAEGLAVRISSDFMTMEPYLPRKIIGNQVTYAPIENAIPGPIFYHMSQSAFELCAWCLWKLQIFRALDPEPSGTWAYHFKFDCQLDEARDRARKNHAAGPSFEKLLGSFIEMNVDYGPPPWLSAEPAGEFFRVDDRLLPAMNALALVGYVISVEDGFAWTEKVRPVMEQCYLWPRNDDEIGPS